jgi:hypothetical protein
MSSQHVPEELQEKVYRDTIAAEAGYLAVRDAPSYQRDLLDSSVNNPATPRGDSSGLRAVVCERHGPRAGSKTSADYSPTSVGSAAKLKLRQVS